MTSAVPNHPEAIDAAWLSEVLGGEVQAIRIEPITDRRGVNAETFRLVLDGSGIPRSVVVKLPTPSARGVAAFQRWYEREVRFYRELAESTPLRSPRCYSAQITPDDDFLLVLEDLSRHRQGDQVAGCSAAEAQRVLHSLAAMHARWWEDSEPGREGGLRPWLPYSTVGLDRAARVQGAFARAWERARPAMPYGARAAIDAGVRDYVDLLTEVASGRVTLCHGDFRLDNLFMVGDEPVAFDWQFTCRARGTYDAAYFLALDLPEETLARDEERLLSGYREALAGHGVAGYTESDCRRDYAVSLILATAVFAIGAGAPQPSEASRLMHEVGLSRLGAAVERAVGRGDL